MLTAIIGDLPVQNYAFCVLSSLVTTFYTYPEPRPTWPKPDRPVWGVSNGNKQTFVHGDFQPQPSTPSSCSATAAATAGIDPKRL